MRRIRATRNAHALRLLSQLEATRKPLIAKNTITALVPSVNPGKMRARGSAPLLPSVSGQQCESSTAEAATKRSRLKLLSRLLASSPIVGQAKKREAHRPKRDSGVVLMPAHPRDSLRSASFEAGLRVRPANAVRKRILRGGSYNARTRRPDRK